MIANVIVGLFKLICVLWLAIPLFACGPLGWGLWVYLAVMAAVDDPKK